MYKEFDYLCNEARMIREEVFVEEQGFTDEFDEMDDRAVHLVLYDQEMPIAVCRYFKDDYADGYVIGRIAVRKAYRGKHIGNDMMEFVEKSIRLQGGTFVFLSAQVRAKEFYEKSGYAAEGEIYMDEFCKHIRMVKQLG